MRERLDLSATIAPAAVALILLLAAGATVLVGYAPPVPVRIAPQALTPAEREIDFAIIEPALAKAARNDAGDIALTTETGVALETAGASVPLDLAPEALARVLFLIRKSFPGGAGAQLAALFEEYYRYRRAERHLLGDGAPPAEPAAELARLERRAALRARHFGTARAERLFGRQHALESHILALRQLEAAPGLSAEARAAARRRLEAEYERRVRRLPD